MKFSTLLLSLACASPALLFAAGATPPPERLPNILYILADDMGQGDLSTYNSSAAWRTPNIDRLAAEGVKFTDAHSASAVCTPSRYSLLTGRYAWRSRLKSRVLFGFSSPLIEPGRLTAPELLRQRGYTTAMIGKWHLGLDWTRHPSDTPPAPFEISDTSGPRAPENAPEFGQRIDYDRPFGGGPTSHGFDSFFGISASLDMDPYVWLRDDRVASPPTRRIDTSKLPAMWRAGPIANDFAHASVQERLTQETLDYLSQHDGAKPFFLYLAYASPHTPIVPSPAFAGRTGSPYGDFCLQLDHDIGEILRVLEEKGLTENTLVIFTSDNGCSPAANFPQLQAIGHNPQPGLRGAKADIYEGGHRVPFLARWPKHVPAGAVSDALVGQIDFLATCAELVGVPLPDEAGEDSISMLPLLLAPDRAAPTRETLVHHSVQGAFAIRRGDWKLCLTPDSGGWSDPKPGQAPADAPPFQLFNLTRDRAETTNAFADEPALVAELAQTLKAQILSGRSTPGAAQANTGGNDWPELAWMKRLETALPASARH
jgi:Arylsulfatase A and related enzymes